MSSVLFFMLGLFIGASAIYIYHLYILKEKNTVVEDYKKGIDIHNKREIRLIFINQSIKDYVKQQLDILKKEQNYKTSTDETIAATRYIAFKDIEQVINKLEKNSEDLKV